MQRTFFGNLLLILLALAVVSLLLSVLGAVVIPKIREKETKKSEVAERITVSSPDAEPIELPAISFDDIAVLPEEQIEEVAE